MAFRIVSVRCGKVWYRYGAVWWWSRDGLVMLSRGYVMFRIGKVV